MNTNLKPEAKDLVKDALREIVREEFNEDQFLKNVNTTVDRTMNRYKSPPADAPNSADIFSRGANIRVKGPGERYRTTKSVGKHRITGEPIRDGENGPEVETASELEHAKMGVLFKHWCTKSRAFENIAPLTEHECALLDDMIKSEPWLCTNEKGYGETSPNYTKALLDESGGSGGLEVVPITFDRNIVDFGLLSGELYPFVDRRPVEARRVEGASIGNVTVQWGTTPGTAHSLFDTSALVAAIDTTVFDAVFAVEVSENLLDDSPVNIGMELEKRLGNSFAAEMDKVIAVGDGTTQPQGIFTASGTTNVGSTGAYTTGPLYLDDAINLFFAVPLKYRKTNSCAYVMNDTTYSRFRSIATGVTGDDRLLFGHELGSYAFWENGSRSPVRIQNDIPNNKIAFGCLRNYRAYLRRGISMRWVTEGKTLALSRTKLLIGIVRIGGRIVDVNSFATMVDAMI